MAKKKVDGTEDVASAEIELTEEEQAEALSQAKARKAATVVAEADAKQAEADAAAKAAEDARLAQLRKETPAKYIGCLYEGMPDPVYQENPHGDVRERLVILGMQAFEHVSDDADGVWLYRSHGR